MIKGQIRKLGNGREFLPLETLQQLSSITALQEAPKVSNKYSFFSTMDVINQLSHENWLPVSAQEQRVKDGNGRQGYQKHMVRFRQPGTVLSAVGGIAPEIVMTNSHDASSSYTLMAGFFRLACLNGLIVSEGEFGSIRMRHMGFQPEDVVDASYKIIEEIPQLIDKIGSYRDIILSRAEQDIFGESALALKFDAEVIRNGNLAVINDRHFSLPELLKPTRSTAGEPSLWNTFNAVQEKFTKGNSFERTTRMVNGKIHRQEKVRGINGLNETVRVNRGLWHLMEKMRELKAA